MRIIAGEHRGRRLLPPDSSATRPITDRAKQSLFDILAPLLPGARVHDCFAGTGSFGLECLSRGAAHASFFEADRSAVARLRRNISALGVGDRSRVIPGDLFQWFAASAPTAARAGADLIFLDPPYRYLTDEAPALRALAARFASTHLAPAGLLIFRRRVSDQLDLSPFHPIDHRAYGDMAIDLLQPTAPAAPES